MGSAQSSNYTNTVIGTYTKVVQETNNTALVNSSNQVKMIVEGGKGDVSVKKIDINQIIKNDLIASFETVNESSVLQKVSQEISQQASSLISGLNLGNFSESTNSINTAINASMDVSQTISTSCVSSAVNDYNLEVKGREGNVTFEDVKVEQSIENGVKCAAKSLNKSIASQEIENKIAQTAKSETKGLSLDFFGPIIIIMIVMLVVVMIGMKTIKQLGVVAPFLLGIPLEGYLYNNQLDPTKKDIKKIEETMKENEKIFKQPKPLQQIRTFSYTCGLYGIGNYMSCFSMANKATTQPPPLQNVRGCMFTEVPVNVIFSNPDQAYDYWLNDPKLNGLDIISRNNGEYYEYHFYSKVSKECIKVMEDLTKKDSPYVKIPPLFCEMLTPVANSNFLPTLAPDAAPTFVFTLDGNLYYTENNKWIQVNSSSLFTATSADNIQISISPLEDVTVTLPDTASGDFFFIDMSNARAGANVQPTNKYFYKIYKYTIKETQKPGTNFKIPRTSFTVQGELDVTDLVLNKKIGPFMANPKALSCRNYTCIFDPDIDIKAVQVENQKELDKLKEKEKSITIGMGSVGGIALLMSMASGASLLFGGKPNTPNTSTIQQALKK